MLAIWSLVLLSFLNPSCTSGSSRFTYCWSLAWRILSITLLAWEINSIHTCVKNNSICWMWHSVPFLEEPEYTQGLEGPKSVGMKVRRTFWTLGTVWQRGEGGDARQKLPGPWAEPWWVAGSRNKGEPVNSGVPLLGTLSERLCVLDKLTD